LIHIYWHLRKPSDLAKITIGLALCNKSFRSDRLTVDAALADCPICRERHQRWATTEEGKAAMSESKILDEALRPTVAAMTGPQIVAKYNELATAQGKPTVKKFRSLDVARQRLAAISKPAETAAEVDPQPRKESKARKETRQKKIKKNGLAPDAMITILKKDAYSAGRQDTECSKRFKKLASKPPMTVSEFCGSIGAIGDLKWWLDEKRGFIKVG